MSETETATSTIDPAVVPAAIESTESTESTESPTSHESETHDSKSTKPAGYAPIDPATATPEQTKERLDYLYGQVKHSDREKKEMRRILSDQARVIDELSKGQQIVVNHLTQKSFSDSKEQLQRTMQEAWKKGDERSYIEAQNKLMDLNVEERIAARQPQPQQQNQRPQNATEIANGAVQSGELTQDEYRATESWMNERDESGNSVRPWAYAEHPDYQAALFETRSVMANPRLANLTYQQKLAEVDKRMGVTKRSNSQTVMGGNLTRPNKTVKVELSPKQREIALKSKYAGKGKSDAENLEAYRKQVEKYESRRAK